MARCPSLARKRRCRPLLRQRCQTGASRAIQVNFCKNPRCANFGVPASLSKWARRSKSAGLPGTEYKVGAAGKNVPTLQCLLCGESLPIKSNAGVAEELERIGAYLTPEPGYACRTDGCANTIVAAPAPHAYHRFGRTERGSARYRCRACLKTFSVPASPIQRQRASFKNRTILSLLMNKSPLSRICEVADVSKQTVYDKLNFFHDRLRLFVARYERPMLANFERDRLYIAVDRQDYNVNWARRKDKRNIVLRAIGSADLDSGYVFGMHLNFDRRLHPAEIAKEAKLAGDYDRAPAFRRYARLWLDPDYVEAQRQANQRLVKSGKLLPASLDDDIQVAYLDAEAREDADSPELITSSERFTPYGMQVRTEYTMYGHFYFLRALFERVAKVRFYMDQESGIKSACFAAFKDEVRDKRCDAFHVRLAKEMTVDDKRKVIKQAQEAYEVFCAEHPELEPHGMRVAMMKEAIAAAKPVGPKKERWPLHPFPNNGEPMKALCFLTDSGGRYDEDHLANLYLKGSLHAIDRFFMQVRRRISLLERPIGTASKVGRVWHGYSAYRPQNIEKVLDIFRVYYNYCLPGKDRKTPAMRLGLATHVIEFDELLGVK